MMNNASNHRLRAKLDEARQLVRVFPGWMRPLGPYGLALLLVVAGGLVRWALVALVGPGLYTFITFYPFVMLAALVGGWGPGFLATLAAALWANYWLMPPYAQFGFERSADAVNLVIFCSIGTFMSVVAGLFQRTRGHLKELVQERTHQLETADVQLQAQAGELRTANEELRQSEYLRRLAEEITRVGAFEWNIITGVNTWTAELEALYGLPPGGFAGTYTAWEQLVHPEDRVRAAATVRRAFETSATVEDEWRVTWPDGSIHWLAGRFRILRDEAGQPRTLTGVNIDITERKQAEAELAQHREHLEELVQERAGQLETVNQRLREQAEELAAQTEELRVQTEHLTAANEALHESEDRLHLALGAAKMGAWQWEVGTQHVVWSPELYALLGYEPGRVTPTHQAFRRRIHPQDLARWEQAMRESMERCEDYSCEFRVVWADGSVHWVEARGQYAYTSDGSAPEPMWMRGVLADIEGRKQAEEALRRSERQFKSTFENAAIGIAHVALDGHILQFNSRFCEIAGYLPEEIVGRTCEEITFADDWKAETVQMQRLLEGQVDHYSMEKRYIRKDGSPVWVNLTRSLQRGEAGQPEYFITLVADISERKRAEEALRELTATLESKVAQRTAELRHRTGQLQKLTLDMSEAEDRERKRMAEILHDDLQQQVAGAKFHLGLLRNRVKYDSSLQAIGAQVDHMLKDAIDKSRSLSHELSPTVLHHGDFAETIRWLAHEVQAKHGLLVHVHAPGVVRVQAEALKGFVYRAAQELLFNIVKHAGVSEAHVRVRQCCGYVCLSVLDRGRGFDPQELRETAGFGLLSIQERIQLLGGRMKIKSARGKGSTFLIVVPNGETPEDRRQKTADGKKTAETTPSSVLRSPSSVLRFTGAVGR